MSEPFIGQITMFAGTFAPRSWAFCEGQLLAISQNDALFSLLGTIYGGDGRTTFGLPDLRGRVPIHYGHGPGLSVRSIGAKSGQETVTLSPAQVGAHTHTWGASDAAAQGTNPVGALMAKPAANIYSDQTPTATLRDGITDTGGSQPHTNVQPFQCIHFIIALFGVYPSRN